MDTTIIIGNIYKLKIDKVYHKIEIIEETTIDEVKKKYNDCKSTNPENIRLRCLYFDFFLDSNKKIFYKAIMDENINVFLKVYENLGIDLITNDYVKGLHKYKFIEDFSRQNAAILRLKNAAGVAWEHI